MITRGGMIAVVCLVLLAGPAQAKNLYVSTAGNDSTTYAANDVDHPWLTVEHAWDTAQANDIVYYRTGTYTIATQITSDVASVTHKACTGETVAWNDTGASWLATGNAATIYIETANITIDGINITTGVSGGESGFFRIGYNTNGGSHFTLKNATCYRSVNAHDNSGIVHARFNAGCDYVAIQNCIMHGVQEATHWNSALIWLDGTRYALIENCELYSSSTGIYYKHSNELTEGTGPTIRNNYFHQIGGYDYGCAILTAANYMTVENNLFVGAGVFTGIDGGAGQGGTGSDYCTYDHNTFFNTFWRSQCPSSVGDYGATHNTISNNIFYGDYFGFEYDSSSCSETTYLTSSYNLFPSGNAIQFRSSLYTLANWPAALGSNANSAAGVPTFSGGETPSTIAGFALTAASAGYQACADSSDMGADVSLVGPSSSTPTSAPSVGLSIQSIKMQ